MKRIYTPAKKKTVLIVTNDPVFIPIFHEGFSNVGCKVEVVSNGESAMQKLAEDSIELVLLDLCQPEIKAIEVLKNVRAGFETLPIVAISNPYLTNLTRTALEAGATKCLAKDESVSVFELVRELLAEHSSVNREPQFNRELDGTYLSQAPDTLARLRAVQQNFARAAEEDLQQTELSGMHRLVHSLGAGGLLGFRKISQMTTAFEALLIELHAKPRKITPSVVRTLAQAGDALALLFDRAATAQTEAAIARKILVVDDEIISREAICSALAKADLVAVSLDDSFAAQDALTKEHFDLVFLDVEMPGQNGFELCVKIREMPANRTTPVVFVTSHSDFASRAQSALSGGNDFIAKPFLSVELVVKTLTRLFKESPPAPSMPVVSISAPVATALNVAEEFAHSSPT